MGDIGHQVSAFLVRDFAEFGIVPITGVSRCTTDDETGFENFGLGSKGGVINEVGVGGDSVGEGLEIDG